MRDISLLDSKDKKLDNGKLIFNGQKLLNFSSNDYLGLSKDKKLILSSMNWTRNFGVGLASSRLVSGNLDKIGFIEKKISELKKKEESLILGSGFQTNSTLIPAVIENNLGNRKKTTIFSDKLNHSSIYYGCILSKQKILRYNHLDYNHLENLIKKERSDVQKIIISETVFSMDGDIVDVEIMRSLALKYNCILYLDEAHASGIFGLNGFGLTSDEKNSLEDEVVVGTFSKAFGSYGSYVSCSKKIKDRIVNLCSGLIYSTALPPPVLGAINAAVDKIPLMKETREKILRNSMYLKKRLLSENFDIPNTKSQIIPIIFSSNEKCLKLSYLLEKNGFFVTAIQPPTVPVGKSRIRLTITKFIKRKQLNAFLDIIIKLNKSFEKN